MISWFLLLLQKPCLKPDFVCQAPSDSLQSGAPLLHISCQTLTSPTWEPPLHLLFFVSTFPGTALPINFLLSAAPHLHRLLNLLAAIIALQAKCDTTSIFPLLLHVCHRHPSPGIIIAGTLSVFFLRRLIPLMACHNGAGGCQLNVQTANGLGVNQDLKEYEAVSRL